jgi:hypothetical protein
MARTETITREELIAVIDSWASGVISDNEMHYWALNNYFPLHQSVAPEEPKHVALAIGIVLTEIECANPPQTISRNLASYALALVNASAADFAARKLEFYEAINQESNAL